MPDRPGRGALFAFALAALALGWLQLSYAAASGQLPTWDEAEHMHRAARMWRAMLGADLAELARAWLDSDGLGKPPLQSVALIPLLALGAGEWAAPLAGLAMQWALGAFVFGIARRLYGEAAALPAAIGVWTLPMVVLTYRGCWPEGPETVLVAAWVWALTRPGAFSDPARTPLLGALLGLGLLSKAIFPFFIAAPTLLHLVERGLLSGGSRARTWAELRRVLLIGGAIALTWYGGAGWRALRDSAHVAGAPRPPGEEHYLVHFYRMTRYWVWVLAALAPLSPRWDARRRLLGAWLLPGLALGLFPHPYLRFGLPAMPALPLLAAGAAAELAARLPVPLARLALALLLLLPADKLAMGSIGRSPLGLHVSYPYPDSHSAVSRDPRDIVSRLSALSRAQGRRPLRVLVAACTRAHNEHVLGYFAALAGEPLRFTSPRHKNLPRHMERLESSRITHVLAFQSLPSAPDCDDVPAPAREPLRREALERLRAPGSGWRLAESLRLEEGVSAELYERAAP